LEVRSSAEGLRFGEAGGVLREPELHVVADLPQDDEPGSEVVGFELPKKVLEKGFGAVGYPGSALPPYPHHRSR
jgi:hypothetical protein